MQQSSARIFGGRPSAIPTTTPADDEHVKVQYVWDLRYIDAPVLRWRDTGGDPDLDETLYYCNDANMNVTALVEPDGDVAERYVYDPYGSLVHDANGNLLVHSADWSSTVTWPNSRKNEILFGGYRLDPETNLYHVRFRIYHPTLGRWLQRDPIGYADGWNSYAYCRSSPSRFVDPLGTLCGDCNPPTNSRDNAYDIKVSDPVYLPGNARPTDADWDTQKAVLKAISVLGDVQAVGGGAAGGLAKSGAVVNAVSGALKDASGRVAKRGLGGGMMGAAFDGVDGMTDTAGTTGAGGGGTSMWVKVSYKSCDKCTSMFNYYSYYNQCYEMTAHHPDPYRCRTGAFNEKATGLDPLYAGRVQAEQYAEVCRQEAEAKVRSGALR